MEPDVVKIDEGVRVDFIDPVLKEKIRGSKKKHKFWLHPLIPQNWIKKLFKLKRASILVGLTIRYLSALQKKNPFILTTRELLSFNISRQMKSKGLRELKKNGLIKVSQKQGKKLSVQIIDERDES